jgi:predicted exporter
MGRYKRRHTIEAIMAFASAARAYRRMLVRWTDGVRRLAWLVVALSVLAGGGAVWYLAANVRINTNTDDMLSPDLPFRKNAVALSKAFPKLSDNIVVVIDGQTPDLADDAAAAMTASLRKRPKLFGDVYDPAGGEVRVLPLDRAFLRRRGSVRVGPGSAVEDVRLLRRRRGRVEE